MPTVREFPKIFALGSHYIPDILEGEVEITEKLDGSQFSILKCPDVTYYRSKGQEIYNGAVPKMFTQAVDHIKSVDHDIPQGVIFHFEYLQKPKHNALKYDKVPTNHLALFAARNNLSGSFIDTWELDSFANILKVDRMPVLFQGTVHDEEFISGLLDRTSYLGGPKIEGVVVKNYKKYFMCGGHVIPIMCGKFVSGEFKEINQKSNKDNSGKNKLEEYKESFRAEARWQKAVQHLREAGTLTGDPKDIGPLIREVVTDIEAEEGENIKEWLYKNYRAEILRKSTAGLAEWYKEKLLKKGFNNG